MTQPDGFMPTAAFNYDSLAALAVKTQEDWEAELYGRTASPFERFLAGFFDGLSTGKPFLVALFEKWLQSTFGVATTWPTIEDVLADAEDWFDRQRANTLALLGIDVNQPTSGFDPAAALFGGMSEQGNQIINDIVNQWNGFVAGLWTQADAAAALAESAAAIAANSTMIAALSSRLQQSANNGALVQVDFTQLPNSAHLPGFTTTYSGGGSGTYGVTSGSAGLVPSYSAARSMVAVRDDITFLTDVQIVCGVFVSPPRSDGFGNDAFTELWCRGNSTGSTRTYGRLYQGGVRFGCFVSGVETVFSTQAAGVKANTAYFFLAGTSGGNRIYQMREGHWSGRLVASHAEVGTTAQIGAGFRRGGVAAWWYESALGFVSPGYLPWMAFADNSDTATLGSFFRAQKTSGSANINSGNNPLPASWYTLDRITPDFAYDAPTNTLTYNGTRAGPYTVVVSQRIAASLLVAFSAAPILYRNGTVIGRGGHTYCMTGITAPVILQGAYPVYLQPGDTLSPGVNSSGAYTAALESDAAGTDTHWEVMAGNGITL